MTDEHRLRERAREAIRAGTLPERGPDRTWGGPGTGVECSLCRARIGDDEIEVEVEVAGDQRKLYMHPRCFAAWDSECRARGHERRPPHG